MTKKGTHWTWTAGNSQTSTSQTQASTTKKLKLVDLSGSDDSLDWDALARINIEGWGADSDSH